MIRGVYPPNNQGAIPNFPFSPPFPIPPFPPFPFPTSSLDSPPAPKGPLETS